MAHTIELKADVSLTRILCLLGEEARTLNWAILYLWATGDIGSGQSMQEFERTIAESPAGLRVNWDQLYALAGKFDQVIDGVFIGCDDAEKIRRYEDEQTLEDVCDLVIEAIDSTVWRISAKNFKTIEKLSVAQK